jgi:hypothetical protein
MVRIVAIIAALTYAPLAASAQVVLEYLPEGEIVEIDGVEYMAYDLETFREVAEVDLELQACLERESFYRDLSGELSAQVENLINVVERRADEHRAALEDYAALVQAQAEDSWLHPIHTPIELGLLGTLVAVAALLR